MRESRRLESTAATSTEPGSGGIACVTARAHHLHWPWRIPGDCGAAHRRATSPAELRSGYLISATTSALNFVGRDAWCLVQTRIRLIQTGTRLIQTRIRCRSRLGRAWLAGRINRDHLESRPATAAAELRAGGKTRSAIRACDDCGCGQGYTGNAAETASL